MSKQLWAHLPAFRNSSLPMYTSDCVKMRQFLLNCNCQWELWDTNDAFLLHGRSNSLIGSKILLQVDFQHVPELFTMPLQLIVSIQTIFLFSFKAVMCWTSPGKLRFSWLPFFFGKKSFTPSMILQQENIRSDIWLYTVFHHCPMGMIGLLCILFFFFSYLGKLHCILLLLKVREEIEDWLQGYGVPWEKSSYTKALFRVN